MINDIDKLMNSIFPAGKGYRSQPPSPPQPPTPESIERVRQQMDRLERQNQSDIHRTSGEVDRLEEEIEAEQNASQPPQKIDSVIEDTQNQLTELRRRLEKDGVSESRRGRPQSAVNRMAAFSGLAESLEPKIVGQREYLKGLSIAFKRPLVMERQEKEVQGLILITGPQGSGRHSGLYSMTEELAKRGALKSGQVETLDLSLYGEQEDTRLFVQDLYRALRQEAPVIVLEGCESCHPAVRSMVVRLARQRVLRLDKRYVEQKGMLVEAGSALTAGAVGELCPSGKYLAFLFQGGWQKEKVADVMGASFLNAMDDQCETQPLDQKQVRTIAAQMADDVVERAQQKLGFMVSGREAMEAHFRSAFTAASGVHGMAQAADRCYRALAEYRLREDFPVPCEIEIRRGAAGLTASFGGGEWDDLFALLQKEYQGEITKVKEELGRVVGLQKVKDYVLALENHYRMVSMRREKGMKGDMPSMHMIFTGNPGTGKTTIARLVSKYLKAIGALSGGQLVEVTRADLVGRYVGHTAPLTTQVIQSALGGVLFIDEAYSLYRGHDDSFGMEAIDTLVKGMEDNRDDLVVILAGYSDEMSEFLTANSGLKSRFPNIIEFPDYTAEELLEIAGQIAQGKGYRLDEQCRIPLYHYFSRRQLEGARESGNGRMARNLVEQAILNQSKRISALEEAVGQEELELLKPDDFQLEEN